MHKYHAIPTTTSDGIRHDSKAEAARWEELKIKERIGEISNLERHVPFPLMVNGIQIGKYEADSVYIENGKRVIEDVKGVRTPLFNWKAKHMAAQGDPVTIYPPKKKKARKCRKPKSTTSTTEGSKEEASSRSKRSRP